MKGRTDSNIITDVRFELSNSKRPIQYICRMEASNIPDSAQQHQAQLTTATQHNCDCNMWFGLSQSYETHKATLRNWWPLFYWLIDVACVNAYRLHYLYLTQLGGKPLTHLEFRQALVTRLLEYSIQARLAELRIGLGGKRLFSPELETLHQCGE